jgi:hypothetical protein
MNIQDTSDRTIESEPHPKCPPSRLPSPRMPAWFLWVPSLTYVAVLVAVVSVLVRQSGPNDSSAQVVFGTAIGLVMFLTVIAGLTGSCWLVGIWRVTAISLVAILVVVVAESSRHLEWRECFVRAKETSYAVFIFPLAILAMAAPLLLLRTGRGWMLCTSNSVKASKPSIGLDQLLLVVTSIGAMMFMTKVPQTVWGVPTMAFWIGVLPMAGFFAGLSLMTTVPTVWYMFRYTRRPIGWVISLVQVAFAVAVVIQVTMWVAPGGPPWRLFAFTPIIASVIFIVGLFILQCSGLTLGAYATRPLPAAPTKVDTDELLADIPARSSSIKRNHLLWTGFTLLVAATSSIALAAFESSRLRVDSQMSQLAAKLRADGGDLVCEKRQPLEIVVGKSASDETVRQYSSYRSLKRLSLAGSQITDATLEQLPNWFPDLQRLDLGHTNVSFKGLQHVRKLTSLTNLGLAGTKLCIDEVNLLIKPNNIVVITPSPTFINAPVEQLDLSETNFTGDDLLLLDSVVTSLTVKNMKLDDQDMTKICQRNWTRLDISGNPVNGSGLNLQRIYSLVARNVPLTDKDTAATFAAGAITNSLDIANTQLTDNALASFPGITTVSFGDGLITDAGILSAYGTFPLQSVSLHGKQFTCECLLQLPARPMYLDLGRSGITDEVLAKLGTHWRSNLGFIQRLNLSETNVSDLGLQALNGCQVYYLNLSRTKVTAQGIIDLSMPRNNVILVDFNQFSPEELKAIRKRQNVVVGEKIPGDVE